MAVLMVSGGSTVELPVSLLTLEIPFNGTPSGDPGGLYMADDADDERTVEFKANAPVKVVLEWGKAGEGIGHNTIARSTVVVPAWGTATISIAGVGGGLRVPRHSLKAYAELEDGQSASVGFRWAQMSTVGN